MDEKQREQLERERKRLVLAESDMRQAAAAAEHLRLHGDEMNENAERALWTGLVVTYARPYVASRKKGVGRVAGKIADMEKPLMQSLHDVLCDRRNDLFAHNDETELRGEIDVYAELNMGAGHFVETWARMEPSALPDVAELARSQEQRFRARFDEIEAELSADASASGDEEIRARVDDAAI